MTVPVVELDRNAAAVDPATYRVFFVRGRTHDRKIHLYIAVTRVRIQIRGEAVRQAQANIAITGTKHPARLWRGRCTDLCIHVAITGMEIQQIKTSGDIYVAVMSVGAK